MATTFQGGELQGKTLSQIKAYSPEKTIQNKVIEQEAPSWIGGTGNPNYRGGMFNSPNTGSQWTDAERARLKAIEAQKQGTLQALQQAQQGVQNQYNAGTSALGGQVQTGRRSLAEYLAQRGLTSSGVSVQGEINALGNLQSGLGQLESTREQALANIAQQRAAAEQTYLQQQADLAGQSEEARMARDLAAIEAGGYNQDVQAEINRRTAINPNDPTIPFLQAQRHTKKKDIATAEDEKAQQEFENNLALQKLYKTSSGSGTSSAATLTKDEAFADDFTQATSGNVSPDEIKSSQRDLIAQYGITKYNQILEAAISNYKYRESMIEQGFGTQWKGRYY